MQGDAERLEQRALRVRHVVGQGDDASLRPCHLLPEGAVGDSPVGVRAARSDRRDAEQYLAVGGRRGCFVCDGQVPGRTRRRARISWASGSTLAR